MKKLSKRFFAFFLAFAMTLAMVPAVFAKTQDGLYVELITDKESYKIGEEAAKGSCKKYQYKIDFQCGNKN